jgi:hypothetical protein
MARRGGTTRVPSTTAHAPSASTANSARVEDILAAIGELFDRAGVSYTVIGGHAVNVWLEPRATADVDLTVQAARADHDRLRLVLTDAGYRPTKEQGRELPSGPDFVRFVSPDDGTVLEIQTAKTDYQLEVIRRAHRAENGVRIAAPEDLIVLKLIAYRPKDRIDLEGLARLPSLDWEYVERWAREWDVLERLREVHRPLDG